MYWSAAWCAAKMIQISKRKISRRAKQIPQIKLKRIERHEPKKNSIALGRTFPHVSRLIKRRAKTKDRLECRQIFGVALVFAVFADMVRFLCTKHENRMMFGSCPRMHSNTFVRAKSSGFE